MIIFPAIDIIDSKPVRLLKGDFSTAKQVAGDALETAFGFEKIGCEWIHMVDLDGSLKKEPVNAETFISVAKNTKLKVELGGGIRTMNDLLPDLALVNILHTLRRVQWNLPTV